MSIKLRGALFKAIKERSTWEKREALKLHKLKEKRIKEEGRARLRRLEEMEKQRIAKAKKTKHPSKLMAFAKKEAGLLFKKKRKRRKRRKRKAKRKKR